MKVLNKVSPSNENFIQCNTMIKEIKELFDRFADSKIVSQELLDLVGEFIKNQDLDGNWRLINSDDMPFDAKIEYWKSPTILFTSILIKLQVIHPEMCANIKGFDYTLLRALEALERGKLNGHGFDSFKFKVNALKMLFQADLRTYMELYSKEYKAFNNMINVYKTEIEKFLLNGKTKFDFNEEYSLRMEELLNMMNGKTKMYIFVYGTLMSNNRGNHTYLNNAEFKGKCILNGYSLYNLGYYPGIVEDLEGKVKGELYLVDMDVIPEIDVYEAEGTLYKRTLVKVYSEKDEPVDAYAYVYIPSVKGKRKIEFKNQPWVKVISENKEKYVWYACYGSNINKERFMKYIKGDQTSINERKRRGCKDKSDPIDEKPYIIKHPIYFSNNSGTWGNRGVAFLDTTKNANCYGKIYLISMEQFDEIQYQEGNQGCWYSERVNLGSLDGIPIMTFTQPSQYRKDVIPCVEYLNVIKKGISNTYPELNEDDINLYLMKSYLNMDHIDILSYLRQQEHGVSIQIMAADLKKDISNIVNLIHDLKDIELIKQDGWSKRSGIEWNDYKAIYYTMDDKRKAIDKMLMESSLDNDDISNENYNEFINTINKYDNARVEDMDLCQYSRHKKFNFFDTTQAAS